jgi:hypothetical protein
MYLKRSYEKPNSKTLNVISTDAEKFTVTIGPRTYLPVCYLSL